MKADTWIKMRKKLRKDGRVLQIARKCNAKRVTVLGALCDLWMLADDYADENGVIHGWTLDDVNAEVDVPGFAESLPIEWLQVEGDSVKVPNYLEHNGSTAKKRADGYSRVNRHRASKNLKRESVENCNAESVTVSYSHSLYNNKKEDESPPTSFTLDPISRDSLVIEFTAEAVAHYEPLLAAHAPNAKTPIRDFAAYCRKVMLDQRNSKSGFWQEKKASSSKTEIDRRNAAERKVFRAERKAAPGIKSLVTQVLEGK